MGKALGELLCYFLSGEYTPFTKWEYMYSQHPVTRTLRGNQYLFEIANVRVNGLPQFNVTICYITQFVEVVGQMITAAGLGFSGRTRTTAEIEVIEGSC